MSTTTPRSGLVELHLAVLLFGGTALFSKLIPLSALNITFLRCAIAALILASIVKATKHSLRLRCKQDYVIAITLGLLVGLHWVTYFAAMQLSTVAIGMIAFFTYPVMTVLIEPIINKTRHKPVDILSGFAVLTGVVLLIPELNLANDVTLGIAVGVLSAALFTARNLVYKRYFSGYSGTQAMFYQTLVTFAMLMPWQDVSLSSFTIDTIGLVLLLGVIFTAAPHALFASALRQLSAKTVGLVSCLQPLYGAIFAFILLHEQVTLSTFIGGAIIVSTAIYETRQQHIKNR